MSAFETIALTGILPAIKIEELDKAVPLAEALRAGGVNAIEVTVRNEIAFTAISRIKAAFPDMAVGAGTILNASLVDRAIDSGAEYCVSPGFNPKTVDYCIGKNMPIVPGCSSVSDIELAADAGLTTVKFFPAEANGGTAALKLINGPFPKLRFIPTGGLSLNNIGDYLKLKCVLACGGSYMAKADTIAAGNWEKITADCRKAVAVSQGFTLSHVGINHDSSEDAERTARLLCSMFCLDADVRSKCTFAGSYVENMNHGIYGEKGHIGFKCNNLDRAVAWFESRGWRFIEESKQFNSKGELTCVYFADEIAGFAIHIV